MSAYDRRIKTVLEALQADGIKTPPPVAVPVAIANGESLSGAIKIDGDLVGLIMPAAWTSAALTFQGSIDGTTFFDIYDAATERTIASGAAVASHFLALKRDDWMAFTHIKVRSGTAGAAVNQAAARALQAVVAP